MKKSQIHYIKSSILAVLIFGSIGYVVWMLYITFNVSPFLSTPILLSIFAVVFFLKKFSLKLKNKVWFNEMFNTEYIESKNTYFRYEREVIKEGKSYIRFVNDYCNEIALYPDESKNKKAAKLFIKELLKTRQDLVERYFNENHFEYLDYLQLKAEYNSTTKTELEPKKEKELSKPIMSKPQKTFDCNFEDWQLEILTKCVNEINLFTQDITTDIMKSVFACEQGIQLHTNNNRLLAKFLDTLGLKGMITEYWQSVCEAKELFLSSEKGQPLNRNDLATATNKSREKPPKKSEIIDEYIQQLKKH